MKSFSFSGRAGFEEVGAWKIEAHLSFLMEEKDKKEGRERHNDFCFDFVSFRDSFDSIWQVWKVSMTLFPYRTLFNYFLTPFLKHFHPLQCSKSTSNKRSASLPLQRLFLIFSTMNTRHERHLCRSEDRRERVFRVLLMRWMEIRI